jgi:hypothetical protein
VLEGVSSLTKEKRRAPARVRCMGDNFVASRLLSVGECSSGEMSHVVDLRNCRLKNGINAALINFLLRLN